MTKMLHHELGAISPTLDAVSSSPPPALGGAGWLWAHGCQGQSHYQMGKPSWADDWSKNLHMPWFQLSLRWLWTCQSTVSCLHKNRVQPSA